MLADDDPGQVSYDEVPFEAIASIISENAACATDPRAFHPGAQELRGRAATVDAADKAAWSRGTDVVGWALVEPRFCNLLFGARQPGDPVTRRAIAWGRARLAAAGAQRVRTPLVAGETWREHLLRDEGFHPADVVTHHQASLVDVKDSRDVHPGPSVAIECLGDRVEEYVALHRNGFGASYLTSERRREWMLRPDYREDLDLVAAGPSGELVGAAVSYLEERAVYIAVVVVAPEHRERGVARALVGETVNRARAAGALTLASTTGAPSMRRLLEDFGVGTVATTQWWECELPTT